MRFSLLQLTLVLSAITCLGAAKKPAPVSIQIYVVADAQDTDGIRMPLAIENAPSEVVVQKTPILSEKDVIAFYPFPGHDGSIGVYFQLSSQGDAVLKNVTTARQNAHLIAVIDGRAITMLLIDRPITDGLIVIPNGISPELRFRLGQQFSIINETPAKTKQRRTIEKKEMKHERRERN